MRITEILPTKNHHQLSTENDPVLFFDTINRLYFDFETQQKRNSFAVNHEDTESNEKSCFITHRDVFYFYGGTKKSKQISRFDCHQSKVPENNLKFNFTGGACASNNKNILLCFPMENKRLFYKSERKNGL